MQLIKLSACGWLAIVLRLSCLVSFRRFQSSFSVGSTLRAESPSISLDNKIEGDSACRIALKRRSIYFYVIDSKSYVDVFSVILLFCQLNISIYWPS